LSTLKQYQQLEKVAINVAFPLEFWGRPSCLSLSI